MQAFLIRGTLFKGALLCCLLVAVVGGLAIFMSQVNYCDAFLVFEELS